MMLDLTKAIEFHQHGLLEEAADAYRQILAADPTAADAWHLLGVLAQVQRELGDETAAAEAWRRSGDRAAGGDLFARKQEGYARRRAGDLEGAAHVLRDCLLRAPQDVILFKTYVGLERQRGATDELKQTLQELLPVAGPRRGAVYAELRRLERG